MVMAGGVLEAAVGMFPFRRWLPAQFDLCLPLQMSSSAAGREM
jgi:type IV secretory pathway TrbD component